MRFRAEVLGAGQGGHAVVVPPEVAAGFSGKRVPVVAQVNGVEYRSRLMVYGGRSYLGLRQALLRQLGVQAGAEVEVDLAEDPEPALAEQQAVQDPPELLAALAADPAARAGYDALPPSHRREYARWIAEAKLPATRADRVARTLRRLADRERGRP